jgi:hypothetical protein
VSFETYQRFENAFRSVDVYTGGHLIQAVAQYLYGYGYSTPFGFEFVSPQVSCGPDDFEAALLQFEFLFEGPHPDIGNHWDPFSLIIKFNLLTHNNYLT